MTKLDPGQIAQYRKELECRPPGSRGRAKALYNLAVSLGSRFKETNNIGDLREAIRLHRTGLALRPEGHPDRHKSLHLRHHLSVAIEVSEIGFLYQEEVVSETNHPPRLFPNCL